MKIIDNLIGIFTILTGGAYFTLIFKYHMENMANLSLGIGIIIVAILISIHIAIKKEE